MDRSEKEEYIAHLEAASLSLTLASTYVDDPEAIETAKATIRRLLTAEYTTKYTTK